MWTGKTRNVFVAPHFVSVELDGISAAGNEQKQCFVADDRWFRFEAFGHDIQSGSDGHDLVWQKFDRRPYVDSVG
jgi:hypothetical protein